MNFSKLYDSCAAAVADVPDGAVVLIGGTDGDSEPSGLLAALANQGARNLTIVCPFGGRGGIGSVRELAENGQVSRVISPNPAPPEDGDAIAALWDSQGVEVEAAPQGVLAERLRAAGAGIGGVFVGTGLAARLAPDKEVRVINGVGCVLETPLRADFALLAAATADQFGNLAYQGAQRAWGAVMAPAARITIAEAGDVGDPGTIDPELVATPGIYVNRIVKAGS